MKIIVDCPQQHKGKNIGWRDYSCINAKTGKKLKHNLGHYIDKRIIRKDTILITIQNHKSETGG